MDKKQIIAKLRAILDRADIEPDGLLNRKKSLKHYDEIEVLFEHISILISDLHFNAEASRRELFIVRSLLGE